MAKKQYLPNGKEFSNEVKASMKTRILTAIIAIAINLPCLIMGDWLIFVLFFIIGVRSFYEIIRIMQFKKYRTFFYVTAIFFGMVLTYWPIFQTLIKSAIYPEGFTYSWHLFDYFHSMGTSVVLLSILALMLVFASILHKEVTFTDGCHIFLSVFVIAMGLQSALYLRFIPSAIRTAQGIQDSSFNFYDNFSSCILMISVLISSLMTDTGAYFTGVLFGKHKMNERISPKKTWEGFWGGIIVSFITNMAIAFTFAILDKKGICHSLLNGVLDLDHWYNIVLLSLGIPFASTLGDFVFSAIKRHYGAKDFGRILPGHGGFLDRIDSVMIACLFAAIYIGIAVSIEFGNLSNLFTQLL